MENVKYISYNNTKYVVFSVNYKNNLKLPALLDYDSFRHIHKLNKKWRCNDNGFLVCSHTCNDGVNRDVLMHELIMLLNNDNKEKKKIIHIDRIGLDNRKENLIYENENINKNIKKKKRTVILPKDSGINPDNIPTYIWYMKPNENHGSRFIVKISDIQFVTTSSRDVPLNDKLEEAKTFLKNLFDKREDLRNDYSMNGDYNALGKELLNSYYDIVNKAGYDYIKKSIPEHNTFKLLE
jgi:hypothetical protein